jgi:hypothetical protein
MQKLRCRANIRLGGELITLKKVWGSALGVETHTATNQLILPYRESHGRCGDVHNALRRGVVRPRPSDVRPVGNLSAGLLRSTTFALTRLVQLFDSYWIETDIYWVNDTARVTGAQRGPSSEALTCAGVARCALLTGQRPVLGRL